MESPHPLGEVFLAEEIFRPNPRCSSVKKCHNMQFLTLADFVPSTSKQTHITYCFHRGTKYQCFFSFQGTICRIVMQCISGKHQNQERLPKHSQSPKLEKHDETLNTQNISMRFYMNIDSERVTFATSPSWEPKDSLHSQAMERFFNGFHRQATNSKFRR